MIFLAADHDGFELKENICHRLASRGVTFEDFGTFSEKPVDYPGITRQLVKEVLKHDGKGILFCKSGEGVAMAANRFKGIRAALAWKESVAKESREDNDANVLALPSKYLSENEAWEIVSAFLSTNFSRAERHKRRIAQLDKL